MWVLAGVWVISGVAVAILFAWDERAHRRKARDESRQTVSVETEAED
jgi:hypothetical protein